MQVTWETKIVKGVQSHGMMESRCRLNLAKCISSLTHSDLSSLPCVPKDPTAPLSDLSPGPAASPSSPFILLFCSTLPDFAVPGLTCWAEGLLGSRCMVLHLVQHWDVGPSGSPSSSPHRLCSSESSSSSEACLKPAPHVVPEDKSSSPRIHSPDSSTGVSPSAQAVITVPIYWCQREEGVCLWSH